MKTLYFLVSESLVGTHLNFQEENIIFLEMRIPLNVKQKEEEYINNTSLKNNKDFQVLIQNIEQYQHDYDEVYVLIGFDADIQGEYMSNVLRDELIACNFNKDKIIRIPFFGDKYLAISNFMNIDDYLNYKGLENKFLKYIKHYNSKNNEKVEVMSFRKALSLLELDKNKGQEFEINNNGTNVFTYITNKLYKNSLSEKQNFNWIKQ